MRSALHRVFETSSQRHFILTYLLDMGMVFALTMLIIATTLWVWVIRAFRHLSKIFPALSDWDVPGVLVAMPNVVAIPIIFVLCYMLYRYVPVQVIPRRTAVFSAGITTAVWEISGCLFGVYLNHATAYGKIYGAYTFLLVLMLWVFYSCAIFIVGAEIGYLLQKRKEASTS
jgi:membrane protein